MARGRSKVEYLEQLADPGFIPPDNWDSLAIARVEVRRLRRSAYMGVVATEQPRRLGGEAGSLELAGDNFLSKKITYVYFKLWQRMVSAKNAPLPPEELGEDESDLYPPAEWRLLHSRALLDDDARQSGLTVIWEDWWEELQPRLHARQRAIATYALRSNHTSWGYRICNSIENEIDWIEDKFLLFYARYVDLQEAS